MKAQGLDSGYSVPKFQLDQKRCPLEESSMTGREDGESDTEEPSIKKKQILHKAIYSSSE